MRREEMGMWKSWGGKRRREKEKGRKEFPDFSPGIAEALRLTLSYVIAKLLIS
jgi:hypothetical protein